MRSTRAVAWLLGLVSIVVWRSGQVARNVVFSKHDFPISYYANGNFSTDCTALNPGDSSDSFKYCEDATFWDLLDGGGQFQERRVLISCDAGRKSWNTVMGPLRNPEPHGSLWLYSPQEQEPDPQKDKKLSSFWKGKPKASETPSLQRLTLKGHPEGHDFHPLGLEIYPSYAGNSSNLYVINHARARTVIEHYTLSPANPTEAIYIRTLTSPYFISPNSIALTSPDSFYVTNDHLFTRRLPIVGHVLPVIESVFGLPFSFVSHITLSSPTASSSPAIQMHTFSALFIPFSNGVSISPSGTHVAVASTTLNQVLIYTRNPLTNTLSSTPETVVHLPFSTDNIHFTHDGTQLIVAGHPHFPTLVAVAAGKTAVAPSWVVAIALPQGDELPGGYVQVDAKAPVSVNGKVPHVPGYGLETLFQSNGTGFSSSSTALLDSNSGTLYVSGLYAEEGVLVCHPVAP